MASSPECLSNLVKQIAYCHALGFTHKELHKFLGLCELPSDVDWRYLLGNFVDPEKHEKILKKSTEFNFIQFCNQFDAVVIGGYSIQCVLFTDENYPLLLKTIHNPPAILYFVGKLAKDLIPISIVGSRDCSPAGESITRAFVRGLSRNKVSIISGGALGIDTIAHDAALNSNIHTVAILGSSLDCLYPVSNEGLFTLIAKRGGAIVSHFPLGTRAAQYTFPIRNELIAGWSVGTLVTEAREQSGSLITAGLALDAGRLVFAVPSDPGRVNARGGNILLRDSGAKCVLSSDDVFPECLDSAKLHNIVLTEEKLEGDGFGNSSKGNQVSRNQYNLFEGVNNQESLEYSILQVVNLQSSSLEQISEQIGVSFSELLVPLGKMEILGTISRDDFGFYHQIGQ